MTNDTLIAQLDNNPLMYRELLTIPQDVNFGLEIELEKVKRDLVYQLVKKNLGDRWYVKDDKSLIEGYSAEIVSPVLQNQIHTWKLLKKLGELLKHLSPSYNNCSFQINFDGSLLPSVEDRVRFIKLFAVYEDIIYRFSKGDDEFYRDSLDTYASPIILALKDTLRYEDNETIIDRFSNNKRYGIMFKTNNIDLIEFRTPNGTNNPILWQNYITTFYYLLKLASSTKYNKKEIDKYIDEFVGIYLLESYEKLRQDKAILFSDLLFENKTDKIYFLHQYMRLGKMR